MVELRTPSSFSNLRGKRLLGVAAGTAVISYLAVLTVKNKKDAKLREGSVAVHKKPPGQDYISKPRDALQTVARPAKNSNVKGSQPTASQWV